VNRWKVILAAVVIFLTGATTGGVLVRNYAPKVVKRSHTSPPIPISSQRRQEYLAKLDRELELTPDQHKQVEGILAASQERMKHLWEPVEPQIKDEYRRTRKEIADVLNPDQREKMKKMHNERDQRRHAETNGGANSIMHLRSTNESSQPSATDAPKVNNQP
jgi:hypothetical protein